MLAWLLPAVLVVVAAVAVVRHHTVDQSPWQGVGFGMFSSSEYLPSRTARVTRLAEEIRARTGADAVRLEVLGHDVEDTVGGLRITLVPVRTVQAP